MTFEPKQPETDVYSASEVAGAAGVPLARVDALMATGEIRSLPGSPQLFAFDQAVAGVRALRAGGGRAAALLFDPPAFAHAPARLPVVFSSAFHAAVAACLVIISMIGSPQAAQLNFMNEPITTRLVFLATPGPGGGGLRQPAQPPRAKREGKAKLDSPIPIREAPKPVAPVVSIAANAKNVPGIIVEPAPSLSDSRGSGGGNGAGLGSGDGSGIGPGSGGGIGGGPYRPGSGITPPTLLKEVKADYTEDARRRNIEGEVLLEIVVRRDGSVGEVTLRNGLDSGLNSRAITAVKQWRFSPAKRMGQPVDVVVEVAVEFKLR
ncbi:MAG: energy transducer TonB [Acidobacteria bacterium]|nr:energy transducer TonB [Acidobacteriota bacterium]